MVGSPQPVAVSPSHRPRVRPAFRALLATVAALGLLDLLRLARTPIHFPDPLLLLVVAYAAFVAGRRTGLLCAGLALAWSLDLYRAPAAANVTEHQVVLAVALPLMALLVGTLKRRADQFLFDARSARILESTADGYIALDRDWRYTYVNARAAALYGRQPQDLIGRRVWDEFPEGVGLPFHEACRRVMRDGQPVVFENHYAPWDRWFENRIYPAGDGVCVYFTDISARKRAEAALRSSEERLRLALQAGGMGAWHWDAGTNRAVGDAATDRLLGVAHGETGQSFEEFLSLIHPDDRAEVSAVASRALRTDGPLAVEYRVRAPDGGWRWMATEGHARRHETTGAPHIHGVMRDVTDARAAAESLRAGEERLRLALDAGEMGTWDWDLASGRIIWSEGHARLFGLEPAGFDGRYETFAERVHPDDRAGLEAALDQARRHRTAYQHEYRVVWPDGSVHWLAARGRFQVGPDGAPVRMVGILRDRTRHHESEAALERLGRLHAVLSGINEAIVRARAPEPLFQEACRILVEVGGLRVAWIGLHGESIAAAAAGVAEEHLAHLPSAMDTETPVIIPDCKQDAVEPWRGLASTLGVRTGAAFPLWLGGQAIGALHVCAEEPGFFGPEESEVMLRLVEDVSFALEFLEGQRRLARLSARLLEVQETERRRVARELHDDVGQALTSVQLNLQLLRRSPDGATARLNDSLAVVGQALETVRNLSLDLRPSILDDLGLVAALRWYAERLDGRTPVPVRFSTDLGDERFPPDVETTAFRVAQEALTNALRHAGAGRLDLTLARAGNQLRLEVRDDGTGFDLAAIRSRPGPSSVGLLGMEERVAMIGGRLTIDSRPAQGTTVCAILPLRNGGTPDRTRSDAP